MASKRQEFAEGLRQTMLAERAGHDFYSLAAEKTRHPDGRRILGLLAAEEASHHEFVRRHYESVVVTGELASGLTMGEAHQLATSHPIFTPEVHERLRHVRFDGDALEIAVQLERNSIDHYRNMAERIDSPEAKSLFSQLAQWERDNYDAFLRLQAGLAAAETKLAAEAR